jgi:hypothetical protein
MGNGRDLGSVRLSSFLILASLVGGAGCTRGPEPAAEVAALARAATASAAAWAPGKSYAVGALVTFAGITYQCRQAHRSTVGWEPPNVPALWMRPTPTGIAEWTVQTNYVVHSGVIHQGLLYECIQAHVSDASDWVPSMTPALWRCASQACGGGRCTGLADDSLCDDGNPCTTDRCKAGACAGTRRPSGTDCSDGNACNGGERCDGAGVCRPGTPLACDDGNACTTDRCQPAKGCTHSALADGASCSDGNVCNGGEVCQRGACQSGTPLTCDDRRTCTTDRCDPLDGCTTGPPAAGTPCGTLTVDVTTVAAGTALALRWANVPQPAGDDVIALFAVGAPDDAGLVTVPTGGAASGSSSLFVFGDTIPGDYELRLLARGVSRTVTSAPFAVTPRVCDPTIERGCDIVVTVSPSVVTAGGTIHVEWSGFSDATDDSAIALAYAGAAGNLQFQTIGPISTGARDLLIPDFLNCGRVSLRLFAGGESDFVIAYSEPFDIGGFKCGRSGPRCDDGNACTTGDSLLDGTCRGRPRVFPSGCEDGDPCTEGDTCVIRTGRCLSGPLKACPEATVCLAGACVPLPPPPPPPPSCVIAFVHGSGDPSNSGKSQAQVETDYWSRGPDNAATSLVRAVSGASGCLPFVVGYDGTRAFNVAAPEVAAQLDDAIRTNAIQPGKLFVVTHSMGGMVMRFILNNGEPNAPFFDPTFQRIRDATAYAVNIQAPHRGSEAADAEFGEADVLLGNVAGFLAPLFGFHKTEAHRSLRRSVVEHFNWGDDGRTRALVLIGGTGTGSASRTSNDANAQVVSDDNGLDSVRQLLCHTRGPLNLGGSQCYRGWLSFGAALIVPGGLFIGSALNAFLQPSDVPGDGLVEASSAFGEKFDFNHYLRFTGEVERVCGRTVDELVRDPEPFPPQGCDPDSVIAFLRTGIQESSSVIHGPSIQWFASEANHNHGRYNDLTTTVRYKTGRVVTSRIGDEIAHFGLGLPCSDPDLARTPGAVCP